MTPESMRIHTIAAVANNGVIGKDNDLVWTLRDDMKFFMNTTKGHVVITGRKNYESIPAKFRPLKDRVNVVVTRNKDYEAPGAVVVHSLADAFEEAKRHGDKTCFVIGGGQIYREALALGRRRALLRGHARAAVDHGFALRKHASINHNH